MGESVDDFFNSLFEVVNHVPFGSKDGLEDPPVQQLSNQSAGTEEISLAVNKGGQIHQARQFVNLYIADFDWSNSETEHDFQNDPASRFFRRRERNAPRSRSNSFFANIFA